MSNTGFSFVASFCFMDAGCNMFLFALRFFKQKLTCVPHLSQTCFDGASWVDFIDPGEAETQSSHDYLQQYFNLAHPAVTCSN